MDFRHETTVAQLAALAQSTRLSVFKTLIRAGSEGMAAGMIASELGVAPNTLSAHLSVLQRAKLIEQRREGRSLIYSVVIPTVAEVVDALVNDCCGGHPEACRPLANAKAPPRDLVAASARQQA